MNRFDPDLKTRLLTVTRSYGRNTPRNSRAAVIPIAIELVPYLTEAIRRTPSQLVLPNEVGAMLSRHTLLEEMLRRSLARAGIVERYVYVCRRRHCCFSSERKSKDLQRCPNDGSKLWPKPVVRQIRFHVLRHTTASLLMMNGVNPAAVQRILRHSDPKITTEVYGHLSPNYLRAETDKLSFQPPAALQTKELEETAMVVNANSFATHLIPGGETLDGALVGNQQKRRTLRQSNMVGVAGFEPAASWSRTQCPDRQSAANSSLAVPSSRAEGDHDVQNFCLGPSFAKDPVIRLLPTQPPGTRLVEAGESLLSVLDRSVWLAVSTATVYRLCATESLPHVRVRSAIRIHPSSVRAYLASLEG